MMEKMIGAVLVIAACGFVGFAKAASFKRIQKDLENLLEALEFMENELLFRMPALADLARDTANRLEGSAGKVFYALSQELDRQVLPEVSLCMEHALEQAPRLSSQAQCLFLLLGKSLGRFHLEGQLSGLRSLQTQCRMQLESCRQSASEKIKSCRTLGLCAGVALAILLF